jgi:hypothetical protein
MTEELTEKFGCTGDGTIGALLLIQETKEHEPVSYCTAKFDIDEDEKRENIEESDEAANDTNAPFRKQYDRAKRQALDKVWMITAAHVAFSSLSPLKDSSFSSLSDKYQAFNDDTSICAIYNECYDIALLPLPELQFISLTKLHISRESIDSYLDWDFNNVSMGDVIIKVGAKTGITFGIYEGKTDFDVGVEGNNMTYSNCIRVKHSPFCKQGDSGSIYYARCATDEYKCDDQNHDVTNWVPIAIHRTSDLNYSYGTPLLAAIKELMRLNKLSPSNIQLLNYVTKYSDS